MLISEAARLTGLSAKMLRRYDELGLLSSRRSDNGYRQYSAQDIQALRFIAQARKLGFSLQDIQELTALWRNPERRSAQVKSLALRHIEQLEAQSEQLLQMAKQLRQLAQQCHGNDQPDCPILEGLNHNSDG